MSVVLTLQIHGQGAMVTLQVCSPSTYYRGAVFSSKDTKLDLFFETIGKVEVDFPSVEYRSTFLTSLRDGLDGAADFTLSNLGPIATTTTKPAGPTTTTTTEAPTTTTTTTAATTTTTTLAPVAYTMSPTSYESTELACAVGTLPSDGYTEGTVDITTLDGNYLFTDSEFSTKFVGDGRYYTISDGLALHAVRISSEGLMSDNYSCS